MCRNLKASRKKSAIIFKIVAKKSNDTRYYSIAMGFKYPKKAGKIPKVKVQHSLGYYFDNDILNKKSDGYKDKMVGRIAGFLKNDDAEKRANRIAGDSHGYEIIVVKAKLTDGLMSGEYGKNPVIAGRHIEWLE